MILLSLLNLSLPFSPPPPPPPPHPSVKEACIILCLGIGSALLLRDVLRQAAQQEEEEPEGAGLADGQAASPVAALNELGVFRLAPGDVLILLGLRAFWPSQ